MTAAQKIPPASAATAQRYAAKAMAAANGQLSEEQARHVFLACTFLQQYARDAEHYSHLLMSETVHGQPAMAAEFQEITRTHLSKVRDQLQFISKVINGEKVEA